jgi:hypothetical protein
LLTAAELLNFASWPTSLVSLADLTAQLLSLPPETFPARFTAAFCIGAAVGLRTGFRAWRDTPLSEPFAQPDDGDPKLYRGEYAESALNKVLARDSDGKNEMGFFLAPFVGLPRSLGTKNLMILAAAGTGKSNLVRAFSEPAIQSGNFVVLHCTKGEVAAAFRREDSVLISPTHRDSWAWDIGADIDGPATAMEFAKDIVPASDQRFWSDTARLVLADIIMRLIADRKSAWGARQLLLRTLEQPQQIRERIAPLDLGASPLISTNDPDGVSKTIESVVFTLQSAALTTLRPMALAWTHVPRERRFSAKKALSVNWKGPRV